MVTSTNTLGSSQASSTDFSIKVSKTSYSDKYTSEVYKADNNKTVSKTEEKTKSEDFKDVLSSQSSSKKYDVQEVNNANNKAVSEDTSKIDELKEKLNELEENSKSEDKDNIEDILNQLLILLDKFGIKDDKLEGLNEKLGSENLKNILQGINEENKASNNLNSIMEKLMELMKNDSVKETLDTDSLKSIDKILSNLSSKLADDNTEAGKTIKGNLKNLMSEISNILEDKQKQNGKILTLEDMLKNKNYSQDSKENSLGNESNKNTSSEAPKSKETSKEDKFLNSLIDDNKDSSSNKINLFASRTQFNQNQSVDTVRGLTINKATFSDDLIKDVKFMSTNAVKELTVKINPGDIGEITIKLIQEDGVMKANLKANSKEATALLAQNLADIKKQLNEQNIKIADVNVELYQEDTTFFKDQGFGGQFSEEQRKSGNSNSSATVNYTTISEDDLINNVVANNSNIELFA